MTRRKPDSEAIQSHLRKLASAPWLGDARKWWPKYVFHFTDIRNAVRILTDGRLLCRNRCPMVADIASGQVIANTDDRWKNYVRLYFRPRTPTQFHNEGMIPQPQISDLGAHCPVPVFFLFDAESVLTLEETEFSNGGVATSGALVGNDSEFFQSLPFDQIYHDGRIRPDEAKRSIIFHRHAEILVPNELNLESIKWIVCRSSAELRTLRHMLPPELERSWSSRFKVGPSLFFRDRTFVEEVILFQDYVEISFNASTRFPEPFLVRLEIESPIRLRWEHSNYKANGKQRVRLKQLSKVTAYTARLTLDSFLAFEGSFELIEIPF